MRSFMAMAIPSLGLMLSTGQVSAKPPEAKPAPTVLASTRPLVTSNQAELDKAQAWVLSFINEVAPPGRKIYYPEGQETVEEATARYKSIARDVISVIYDPRTKPLFTGPYGRARTVAVVLSVMFHESSFMRHVDYGLGKYARGDHGKSWCLMQVKIEDERTMRWNQVEDRPVAWNDPKDEIFEGRTGEEMVQDRQICIREGLKILQISFGGTKGMPIDDRLRIYASGSRDKGALASKNRMRKAMQWYAKSFHNDFKDEVIMQALQANPFLPLPRPVPLSDPMLDVFNNI